MKRLSQKRDSLLYIKREIFLAIPIPSIFVNYCIKEEFKDYNPNQNFLFTPNLLDFIEENHPIRIISEIIKNQKYNKQ